MKTVKVYRYFEVRPCALCSAATRGSFTERGAFLPICGRCTYVTLSREERAIAEGVASDDLRGTRPLEAG